VSRDEDTATLDHYGRLARTWTEPRRPLLVVMHGLSGSGKTWLSTRLMAALPAVRIRSDLERKRMFGLAETDASHSGVASGIYDRDAGEAVYSRLFEYARIGLTAGFDVILDAAFLEREQRERARRMAGDCGAGFTILQASAPVAVLEQRLARRAAGGKDASEADLAVLRHQLRTNEPLTADESGSAVIVDTQAGIDPAALVGAVQKYRGSS
jgi:predicted kinase